jgi:hypothetical protein
MAKGVLEEIEYVSDPELSMKLVQRALKGDDEAKRELRNLHVTYWEHRGEVLLPQKEDNGQR